VVPTNIDPETVQAAKASEKIALWGDEKWGIDEAFEDWVTVAIVADESFAWPYWDDTLGPVLGEDEQGPLLPGRDLHPDVHEQRGRLGTGRPVQALATGG
jgi:hypothetical protein